MDYVIVLYAGERVWILPASVVDGARTTANDSSTCQRNSESRRLQLRDHPARDNVQSRPVLHWHRPPTEYVVGNTIVLVLLSQRRLSSIVIFSVYERRICFMHITANAMFQSLQIVLCNYAYCTVLPIGGHFTQCCRPSVRLSPRLSFALINSEHKVLEISDLVRIFHIVRVTENLSCDEKGQRSRSKVNWIFESTTRYYCQDVCGGDVNNGF